MVMHQEDSGVPDGPVSPGGHRNPSSAHICDVCGVKVLMQCPSRAAINRRQANFCRNCGVDLPDVRGPHATPSLDISPATVSESAPILPEPFMPANSAAAEGIDTPNSFDPVPRPAENGKELVADEPADIERLKQI